jgi:hypothetical protein
MSWKMAQTEHDRRRESRALTAALIQITDEHEDISTCVLEDLSSSGACIHSDIALQVGKQVEIKAASVVHAGVVKYCKPDNEGFTIGIQFVGGKWPSPIGFPIHWIRAERH